MANWVRVYDYTTGGYKVYKDGQPSTESAYQTAMKEIKSDPTARNLNTGRYYSTGTTQRPTDAPSVGATINNANTGNSTANDMINDLRQAQAEAKAANERRYQEILGGYDSRYGDVMQSISGLGATAKADLAERYRDASAMGKQDMVSRGLTGTTVMPNMQRGYDRDYDRGLGSIDESLRRQQADTQANLQGDKLAFMERRTDAYPDAALYSNILQQLGSATGEAAGNQRYGTSSTTKRISTTPTKRYSEAEQPTFSNFIRPLTNNWKSREPVERESYRNPTTVIGGGNLPNVNPGGGYLITQNRDKFTVNPSGQIAYAGKDYGSGGYDQFSGTNAVRYDLSNVFKGRS